MENDKNRRQLQIDMSQAVAQGEYANLVIITHSSSEFILDFAALLPGVPKATVRSRVIMAPEHAKHLLMALKENITRFEKEYGTIQLQEPQKGLIAPFKLNKNEA